MHKDDQMTPVERAQAMAKGEDFDRLPIVPFFVTVAGKVAGMTHQEKRSNAKNQAAAQIACYEKFGHDSLVVEYGLFGIGQALGSTLSDPVDDAPSIDTYVLKNFDGIGSLDLSRVERKNHPWFQLNYEATEILIDKLGKEVPVGISIPGPFTVASTICPTEFLLKAVIKNPDKLHDLLRFSTEAIKIVFDGFLELGAGFTLCDPVASGTILRKKVYDSFVAPYTKELFDYFHSKGSGGCYHICGDTTSITESMVDTGCDVLSVDNRVDMAVVKEKVGHRLPIMGNVDPVEIIYLGNRETIFAGVKESVAKSYDSPKGYTFSTGCDIPIKTTLENMLIMMEAARYYGKMPINTSKFV
ncbi:uroporphyrinogen decarboxylase family protein [Dehalobacterium formicoaceticum]|uniref:Uroporphyrinogen decarboxylase family protein n=1 Tax=Dehalobacterium formicoaceticum TaxID=51515 RepID=A0ABT1Y4D6_9FIRM|nr:uroporphyrinogen decarboxylase family protein [Dehalobacterium formicoaceticum]MCR6545743.1 uroporphyrinogen decarboxylase family protein [Dehalobacterium formicoaceticum]